MKEVQGDDASGLDGIPPDAADPLTTTVDYIVVGSGAGGAPLAARLARAGMRVLVLEAGVDSGAPLLPRDSASAVRRESENERLIYYCPGLHAASTEPDLHGAPDAARTNWNFWVRHYPSQAIQAQDSKAREDCHNPGDKAVLYPRASALGGCTAHHAMISVYGTDYDWQKIADLTGDDSWAPGRMRALYQRIERARTGVWFGRVLRYWDWFLRKLDPGRDASFYRGSRGWLNIQLSDPKLAMGDTALFKMVAKIIIDVDGLDNPVAVWRAAKLLISGRLFRDLDLNDPDTMRTRPEGVALVPLAVSPGGVRRGPREWLLETRRLLIEERGKLPSDPFLGEVRIATDIFVRRVVFEAGEERGVIQTQMDQGGVSDEDVSRALAQDADMDFIDLGEIAVPKEIIDVLPSQTARRYKVIPVAVTDSGLIMATCNPLDFDTFDAIVGLLKQDIDFVCTTPAQIGAALIKYYGADDEAVSSHGEKRQPPRAIGVEYSRGRRLYDPGKQVSASEEPTRYYCYARREVLLCGGAFNTPQILMLSGVGDREHLRASGVRGMAGIGGDVRRDVFVDLPGVGKNLRDRYEISVISEMAANFSMLDGVKFDPNATDDPALNHWKAEPGQEPRSGLYTANGAALAILKHSEPAGSKPKDLPPDLLLLGFPVAFRGYYPGWSKDLLRKPGDAADCRSRNLWSWTILKAYSKNRGTVRLRSSNPFDSPAIDFCYFGRGNEAGSGAALREDEDFAALEFGVRYVRLLNRGAGKLMKGGDAAGAEIQPGRDKPDGSEALADWIVHETWGHHACGTCRIGSDRWRANVSELKDKEAVLDSSFRVHGVRGVRVVDASVFPTIPGYFISVPIYLVSEKAADTILDELSL